MRYRWQHRQSRTAAYSFEPRRSCTESACPDSKQPQMRITNLFRLVLLLGLIAADPGALSAEQQNELQAVTLSPSVTLTLRIADGRRQFRTGEIIPIELTFESAVRRRFAVDGATYDRS